MRIVALVLLPVVFGAFRTATAQTVPVRQATQVFRLGGPDAPEAYAFGGPPQLAVDSGGFIYARLSSEATVAVFGPDGKPVRRIGRKGEGPGEFQIANEHGFVGDTLWVGNWPSPRISMFRKDGTHLSTRAATFDIGHRLSSPGSITGLLAGGRAFVNIQSNVLGDDAPIVLPVLVGAREMRSLDTVVMMPTRRSLNIPKVGSWTFAPVPYPPLLAVSSAGTALATAEWSRAKPGSVTVRVIAPDGTERLRRQLQMTSQPIPSRLRDSLLSVALAKARPQIDAARRRGAKFNQSNEQLVEEGLDLPAHYPPVRTFVIGRDGTLWLERFGEGKRGDWLVLDSRGEALFRVKLPSTLDVHEASATDVWGVDRDELDVSYIVRLKVSAR